MIRFLGFEIYQGTIKPIQRSIEFGSKFPDEIKGKTQLQRFLESLNYVSNFYPNLRTTNAFPIIETDASNLQNIVIINTFQ